jgi:glycosyltransferase involved in cell wall biosynthesis
MKGAVYHSYEKWLLSGVSSWTVNLAQGMARTDFPHKVLFTGLVPGPQSKLDAAGVDYAFFDRRNFGSRREEWRGFKAYLEARAPCIYMPNFDFHRSCAVGIMADTVKVCAVIHSDEHCYYDMLERMGSDCDAIVCVSSFLEQRVRDHFPALAGRVRRIPYGIPELQDPVRREAEPERLRLAYCNRLSQYQKRVLDIPPILVELEQLGLPFHLTIAGSGPDRDRLAGRIAETGLSERVTMLGEVSNEQVMEVLKSSDLFLLTSDFEGLPLSLLEAMMAGCIPVAYRIASGINDAILPEKTGLLVAHGDTAAFAAAVARLWGDPELRHRLAAGAAAHAADHFSAARMCRDYGSLFEELLCADPSVRGAPRSGRIRPPKDLRLAHRVKARLKTLFDKDGSGK